MMRRFLLLFAAFILLQDFASAQVPNHALGIRFGTIYGLGTEISYQRGLSSVNRLEIDLGFSSDYDYINDFKQEYNSWGLTGVYHWVRNLDNNLNWYYGPGCKIGSWSSNMSYNHKYDNGLYLAAAGDIGLEYCFPMGIQLALDARPEIGLFNNGTGINVGFSIRYQFK
jgi:hypothetical protein